VTATFAIAAMQLRIIRRAPAFLVVMCLMPLAIMPLMKNTFRLALVEQGFAGANGAEFVVPGQVVLFSFMIGGSVGFSLYREHGWRTWDRLRASPASPRQILAGFQIPWIGVHIFFQVALFVAGAAVLSLRLNGGSVIALLLVIVTFAFCAVSILLLCAASFRTVNQLQLVVNLGAMVLGGLGGALVPHEQLPSVAQAIAPFTPHYWAMQGFRAVFLEQATVTDVSRSVLILLATGLVATALAVIRFRVDETKEFFA